MVCHVCLPQKRHKECDKKIKLFFIFFIYIVQMVTWKWQKQTLNHKSQLWQCNICIVVQEELSRHTAQNHAATRELHHCLLCQRSFSSGTRHRLHMQGRRHRHLELTQRHTIHAVHRLLVGEDCPRIPSLSRTELQTLQWRPTQPGYSHFYYQLTPLQTVLQVSFDINL